MMNHLPADTVAKLSVLTSKQNEVVPDLIDFGAVHSQLLIPESHQRHVFFEFRDCLICYRLGEDSLRSDTFANEPQIVILNCAQATSVFFTQVNIV